MLLFISWIFVNQRLFSLLCTLNILSLKINIAIDGYSSCGKSTLAKLLSQKLAYNYIDTGAMYRSVTLYLVNHGYISVVKNWNPKIYYSGNLLAALSLVVSSL